MRAGAAALRRWIDHALWTFRSRRAFATTIAVNADGEVASQKG
jgi:hypothetical protein